MNNKKISIIIPIYKPKKEVFDKLKKYLKENAKGIEVIESDGSGGLANAYNKGIKKAKGEIIITIHQDCIPLEKDAIIKIIEPFKNSKVVMTYSKIVDYDSRKKYIPFIPDGKFVGYRKNSLEKVGLFDEKTFFTGGEDVDIYFKLKKIGKIILCDTVVFHEHPKYRRLRTVEKRKQSGNLNGVLFRKYGFKFSRGIMGIFFSFRYPFSYGKYFLKGFISGKQNYRRKDDK